MALRELSICTYREVFNGDIAYFCSVKRFDGVFKFCHDPPDLPVQALSNAHLQNGSDPAATDNFYSSRIGFALRKPYSLFEFFNFRRQHTALNNYFINFWQFISGMSEPIS